MYDDVFSSMEWIQQFNNGGKRGPNVWHEEALHERPCVGAAATIATGTAANHLNCFVWMRCVYIVREIGD